MPFRYLLGKSSLEVRRSPLLVCQLCEVVVTWQSNQYASDLRMNNHDPRRSHTFGTTMVPKGDLPKWHTDSLVCMCIFLCLPFALFTDVFVMIPYLYLKKFCILVQWPSSSLPPVNHVAVQVLNTVKILASRPCSSYSFYNHWFSVYLYSMSKTFQWVRLLHTLPT